MSGYLVEMLPARFEAKIKVHPQTGCWEWVAYVDPAGYGRLSWHNRPSYGHRVVYELLVGPIPPGLTLDHLCRVRRCANPAHLEPVTNRENLARGTAPSAATIRAFDRGRCRRGHDVTQPGALRVYGSGRRCVECIRESNAARYQPRKLQTDRSAHADHECGSVTLPSMTTPHDDLVEHETGQGCVCGPAAVPVVTGDGDSFSVTIHRRLDGLDTLFAEAVESWRDPA